MGYYSLLLCGWMVIYPMDSAIQLLNNRGLVFSLIETLRLRFGHLTANDKLLFALNGFTLLVWPYLALMIRGW